MLKKIFLIISILLFAVNAYSFDNYLFMGDGKIKIGRKGKQTIVFRNSDGSYNLDGLKKLNNLYGTSWNNKELRMSLRLIELLDYLEDTFHGNGIEIVSGFRSQKYNKGLKDKGKMAASSSLHIDAEAIDIVLGGVSSKKLWEFLREQDCCGAGYYHGRTIHIDTGPPRWWDETSSGTEKKEPPENENIVIKTKSDYYAPNSTIGLKFSRVNIYPIGIEKKMDIVCSDGKKTKKAAIYPDFGSKKDNKGCIRLNNRQEGRLFSAKIPAKLSKYDLLACKIRTTFCDPKTEKMPEYIDSNPFVIKKN